MVEMTQHTASPQLNCSHCLGSTCIFHYSSMQQVVAIGWYYDSYRTVVIRAKAWQEYCARSSSNENEPFHRYELSRADIEMIRNSALVAPSGQLVLAINNSSIRIRMPLRCAFQPTQESKSVGDWQGLLATVFGCLSVISYFVPGSNSNCLPSCNGMRKCSTRRAIATG